MTTQILFSAAACSYARLYVMLNCNPNPKFQSPFKQATKTMKNEWKHCCLTAANTGPQAAIQGAHSENFFWVKKYHDLKKIK